MNRDSLEALNTIPRDRFSPILDMISHLAYMGYTPKSTAPNIMGYWNVDDTELCNDLNRIIDTAQHDDKAEPVNLLHALLTMDYQNRTMCLTALNALCGLNASDDARAGYAGNDDRAQEYMRGQIELICAMFGLDTNEHRAKFEHLLLSKNHTD